MKRKKRKTDIKKQKSVRCKLAGCDKLAKVKFCCDDHRVRHHNINRYIKSLYPKNLL